MPRENGFQWFLVSILFETIFKRLSTSYVQARLAIMTPYVIFAPTLSDWTLTSTERTLMDFVVEKDGKEVRCEHKTLFELYDAGQLV